QREHERLRLAIRAGAPVRAPEPRAEHGTAVAARELAVARDPEQLAARVEYPELESLAGLALAIERVDERGRLLDGAVRIPGEEPAHLRIASELVERECVLRAQQTERQAGPAYDHYRRSAGPLRRSQRSYSRY